MDSGYAKTVIVGVGVPGCGKTTYLKPFALEHGMTYINPDDVRQELTGDPSDHGKETLVWSTVHDRIRAGLQTGGVVVDATYTKLRDRRELIAFCRKHGAKKIVAYWFDTPLAVCLERNRGRQRVVPDDVIRKMYNRLHLNPPLPKEGFAEVVKITS